MEKLGFILLLFLTFAASCDSDDHGNAAIPSVVLNRFHADFPNASEINWIKKQQNFKVAFEIDEKEHAILFNTKGIPLKQKKQIPETALPQHVINAVKQAYEGAVFDEVEKLIIKNKVFYQFEIEDVFFDKEVVVTESGEIIEEFPFWE